MAVSRLLGFYLAWPTIRWKTKPMLIFAGVLQLLGILLITIPGLALMAPLRLTGAILLGIGSGVITLAIPSVIIGGRGGAETFVLSFGIVLALTSIGEMYSPLPIGKLLDTVGSSVLRETTAIMLFLGLLFLLPVKSSLFSGPPPQRDHPLVPTYRPPVSVALLNLLPFYWLYWLYRAHGEVASLVPWRNILSPLAAQVASVFSLTILEPIILTTLNDALNKHATELGQPLYRASWVIFLWAFLFPPIAMALVQSTMNRVISELSLQQQAA